MADGGEVQRSLGRIEGIQNQILDKLTSLETAFVAHKSDDQQSFSAVRKLVFDQRDIMKKSFEEQADARNQHLNEQDVKLDALKEDSDRAKGAGWVILGLLATFAGSAVLAVIALISGKLHWS